MSSENLIERRKPDSRSVMFLVYDASSNKFVIEKRIRKDSSYKGFYMIPAGHVESGENPEETLERELKEEQSIIPLEYRHLDTFESVALNGTFFLIDAYFINSYKGIIENKETGKCELCFVDFEEANSKLVLVQDRHVFALVKELFRQNSQRV